MNPPQFAAPVKRRVPALAIVLVVLFVLCGIIAFGWHLLSTTFVGAIGEGPAVTAPQAVAVPDAVTGRLDHIEKMVRELTEKVGASVEAQTAMQSDVSALREHMDQQATERVAAARVAVAQHAALQRRRVVKPTPPPAPPAPTSSVLSVDMWGGKPSVALRGPDGRVQFANTGDRIPGGGVIGSAQASGQTVTIRQADGSISTMTGKEKP